MAGTTTLGYPYPTSGDTVAAEAAKVQALAQAVDDQVGIVKSGTGNVNIVAINTDTALAVVFATAFPAAGAVPTIQLTYQNIANPANVSPPTASAVTRAGFTINARRSVGTGVTSVGWTATAQ